MVASVLGRDPKDLEDTVSMEMGFMFKVTTQAADKVMVEVDLQSQEDYLACEGGRDGRRKGEGLEGGKGRGIEGGREGERD